MTIKKWAQNIISCDECDLELCEHHAEQRSRVTSEMRLFSQLKLKHYKLGFNAAVNYEKISGKKPNPFKEVE